MHVAFDAQRVACWPPSRSMLLQLDTCMATETAPGVGGHANGATSLAHVRKALQFWLPTTKQHPARSSSLVPIGPFTSYGQRQTFRWSPGHDLDSQFTAISPARIARTREWRVRWLVMTERVSANLTCPDDMRWQMPAGCLYARVRGPGGRGEC